jgi:hypothetical protein
MEEDFVSKVLEITTLRAVNTVKCYNWSLTTQKLNFVLTLYKVTPLLYNLLRLWL